MDKKNIARTIYTYIFVTTILILLNDPIKNQVERIIGILTICFIESNIIKDIAILAFSISILAAYFGYFKKELKYNYHRFFLVTYCSAILGWYINAFDYKLTTITIPYLQWYRYIFVVFVPLVAEFTLLKSKKIVRFFSLVKKLNLSLGWFKKTDSNQEKQESNQEASEVQSFLYDEPTLDDDLLRKDYAKSLSIKLLATESKESAFAVGIFGKWGSGKTSFFEMLRKEFEDKEIEVIEFFPWLSKGAEDIVDDFLKTMAKALSPYDRSLSKEFVKYADILVDHKPSLFNRIMLFCSRILFRFHTTNGRYEEIKNKLSSFKQIIVFIDDLDRLDKKEIIEVLRLIRNTANFPNLIYVTAYDRDYLVKAIEAHNIYEPAMYLEKIFNLEIHLPGFESEIILPDLLQNLLKKHKVIRDLEAVKELHDDQFYQFIFSFKDLQIIPQMLPTIRDVKRFVNAFVFNLEHLQNQLANKENGIENAIVLFDFFRIELIRYKYLDFYNLLKDTPQTLIDFNQNIMTINAVGLNSVLSKDNTLKADLRILFEEMFSIDSRSNNPLSISRAAQYFRYFSYRCHQNDISKTEFVESCSTLEYKDSLKIWNEQGRMQSFIMNMTFCVRGENPIIKPHLSLRIIFSFIEAPYKYHFEETNTLSFDLLKQRFNRIKASIYSMSKTLSEKGKRDLTKFFYNDEYLIAKYFLLIDKESDLQINIDRTSEFNTKYLNNYLRRKLLANGEILFDSELKLILDSFLESDPYNKVQHYYLPDERSLILSGYVLSDINNWINYFIRKEDNNIFSLNTNLIKRYWKDLNNFEHLIIHNLSTKIEEQADFLNFYLWNKELGFPAFNPDYPFKIVKPSHNIQIETNPYNFSEEERRRPFFPENFAN